MFLNEIVSNSDYAAADETIDTSKVVGLANEAIAEINTETGSNLPFFVAANYETTKYDAISPSWLLKLIAPYLSYMTMSNDDNTNQRDFHYQRFLKAINSFKSKGIKDIKTLNADGTETGYAGKSARVVKMDVSARTVLY